MRLASIHDEGENVAELPNAAEARVPRNKIEGYLLSLTHPTGRSKARFFRSVGLTTADQLDNALRAVALSGQVTREMRSRFGTKYVVDAELQTPRGIRIPIRTVWIVEVDAEVPRLVTAYPRRGSR